MSTLEQIQTRLEKEKNCLPPEVLQRLQKALTEGVDAEKCGSFLSEIEEIHRQLETAGRFTVFVVNVESKGKLVGGGGGAAEMGKWYPHLIKGILCNLSLTSNLREL